MTTCYQFQTLHERHPRLWEACRRKVADDMVAQGWVRKASKFNEVCRRRADRMLRESL